MGWGYRSPARQGERINESLRAAPGVYSKQKAGGPTPPGPWRGGDGYKRAGVMNGGVEVGVMNGGRGS